MNKEDGKRYSEIARDFLGKDWLEDRLNSDDSLDHPLVGEYRSALREFFGEKDLPFEIVEGPEDSAIRFANLGRFIKELETAKIVDINGEIVDENIQKKIS